MKYNLIYLAAGNSRRFGRNKLLEEWKGAPLYEQGLKALKEAVKGRRDCEIFLVSQYENILQAHPEVRCVYSPKSTEGLSRSIHAGTQAVLEDGQEQDFWLLFLAADQPLIRKETIQALLQQAEGAMQQGIRILRARYAGKEGNPVLFHASLIPELLQLQGDEGGRSVIRAHREEVGFVDVGDDRQMFDVDRVEDLEKVKDEGLQG